MNHIQKLESLSIYILREAYANIKNLCMLWSIGKDSTVLLWLVRKAFFGTIPFPLLHIDTSFKIPDMIIYRDFLVKEWKLPIIYGINQNAIAEKKTFPDQTLNRLKCCDLLKTKTLINTLNGKWPRYKYNHITNKYEPDNDNSEYTGVIVGIRSDEEGSRSKERYFSQRNQENRWEFEDQPPEFWDQFNVDCAPGAHVRIHPLLDWTEINIWEYIQHENIPTVSLYYDNGSGKRYRSLGCYPCTFPITSKAKNPAEIINELQNGQLKNVPERSGRSQDAEDGGGLETLRRNGYM
ncbi:MAG: sulfate adenylyltransferase subunit CysD [Spirochaetes bacterium]|nr:sulfate adenylyltransferase subunit CysD [Spirochaetota bacterium]